MSLDAPIIMAGVTIFAIISWWFTPTDAWISKKHSSQFEEADTSAGEEITRDSKNVDASR
jgi:hypothetical protein